MSNTSPRIKRRTPFVIVESSTVRDARLKYADLGLLTYLLDQSEEWQVRSEQLSKGEGREGRDAVRKMLHRLASCGYYRLERRRFRTGKTAMGTAVSDHPVDQWAADYVTFGEQLDIPVVEQEDGTFRVKYPDGTLGTDGFDTPDASTAPSAGDEPEEPADAVEPATPAKVPTATAAKRVPPARKAAPPKKSAQKKAEEAAQKAAEKALLDADAEEVAAWWWAEAEQRFGPYVGDKKGFLAMRMQVRNALAKNYTKNQCGKALIRAERHWPSAQQWQNALGIVTNHIQPGTRDGRVPYSDSATWGATNEALSTATVGADLDADDATFGVVERP